MFYSECDIGKVYNFLDLNLEGQRKCGTLTEPSPGAGLMNTVINYASGKPSDPLHGYSYVHNSNL